MAKKLTEQQRIFAEAHVSGLAGPEAVAAAGYKSKGKAARVQATRLLANDSVKTYVKELREKAAEKAGMDQDDLVSTVVDIIRAKPSEAGPENPLCEIKMSKAGEYYAFPSKAWAMDRLVKLMGWDAPEKHDIQVNDLRQIIARARAKDTR